MSLRGWFYEHELNWLHRGVNRTLGVSESQSSEMKLHQPLTRLGLFPTSLYINSFFYLIYRITFLVSFFGRLPRLPFSLSLSLHPSLCYPFLLPSSLHFSLVCGSSRVEIFCFAVFCHFCGKKVFFFIIKMAGGNDEWDCRPVFRRKEREILKKKKSWNWKNPFFKGFAQLLKNKVWKKIFFFWPP